MPKNPGALAGLPGVTPFMMTLSESAAMCRMNIGFFRKHCTVTPVRYNKKLLYPTEDVQAWARAWYIERAELGDGVDPGPGTDWVEERFGDDDQDAA